jgi:hypothetical protein
VLSQSGIPWGRGANPPQFFGGSEVWRMVAPSAALRGTVWLGAAENRSSLFGRVARKVI